MSCARGSHLVTLRDVASLVGVSVSTASRALKGNPRISERTKNAVIRAARKLGYVPNGRENLKTIALLLINPHKGSLESDEFFNAVQKGIIDSSGSSDVLCLVNVVHPENPASLNISTEITEGIIVGGIPMPSFVRKFLQNVNLPVVLIGKYQDMDHLPSVNNDNVRGGYIAGLEILRHGYKNVLILTGPLSICTFADRVEGAMSAFRRNQVSLNKIRIVECKAFDEKSGKEAIAGEKEFFRSNVGTAIFATTDWLAKGALEALKAIRVVVPQEVGIIGFGGLQFCRHTSPPLASIQLNPYLIGKIAFVLLSEMIDGKSETAGTIFVGPSILKGGTLCQQ